MVNIALIGFVGILCALFLICVIEVVNKSILFGAVNKIKGNHYG